LRSLHSLASHREDAPMSRLGFLRWLSRLFPSAVPSRSHEFRPRVESFEDRLAPATFTVTSTANSGTGSLRAAIVSANTTPGADVIDFSIAGSGVKKINVRGALPTITETVTIDATTQPGYANFPLIALNGTNAAPGASGLVVGGSAANGSVIKGLLIQKFAANGIVLLSNGNTVR